jgi:hypothetical protein
MYKSTFFIKSGVYLSLQHTLKVLYLLRRSRLHHIVFRNCLQLNVQQLRKQLLLTTHLYSEEYHDSMLRV